MRRFSSAFHIAVRPSSLLFACISELDRPHRGGPELAWLLFYRKIHQMAPMKWSNTRLERNILGDRVAQTQQRREGTSFEVTVVKTVWFRALPFWHLLPKFDMVCGCDFPGGPFSALRDPAAGKEDLCWVVQVRRNLPGTR